MSQSPVSFFPFVALLLLSLLLCLFTNTCVYVRLSFSVPICHSPFVSGCIPTTRVCVCAYVCVCASVSSLVCMDRWVHRVVSFFNLLFWVFEMLFTTISRPGQRSELYILFPSCLYIDIGTHRVNVCGHKDPKTDLYVLS